MKVVYKKELYRVEKTESCILEMLAYFSIFEYPLTKDDIQKFLPPAAKTTSIANALSHLVSARAVFKIDEFYLLQDDPALIRRRIEGNLRAMLLLPKAKKIGAFLSRFPYVRGIGISGSLSKNYAHEKADFDFFIITKANRLWVARTFMHLFKKLTFLTGTQHYYCMNYYLDEQSLKLKDQNIYTAIEISTLIPVNGKALHDFFIANTWVSEWFTAWSAGQPGQQTGSSVFKKLIEWLFNNKAGDKLDDYFMRMTSRRWKKKEEQRKRNYEGKEMALVTGKHYAWSNPDSFQERVLSLYNKKLAELKSEWPQYFQPLSRSFEE
ncbi:MAG: hypothetical protein ACHQFX_14830 [Chitinophagales bacterium]